MLHSMTSYGQSLLDTQWGELRWEIRSVNHRYLDVSVKLPDNLRCIDVKVRELIGARVFRGKIDAVLRFSDTLDSPVQLKLNQHLLQQLIDAAEQVQLVQQEPVHYDPVRLLQWPGVVNMESALDNDVIDAALASFEQALDDFLASRVREGQQIEGMLKRRASQMETLVAQLRKHRPSVVLRQRQKLTTKLAELNVEYDTARLEQELVYAAQRLDIDEELDRIDAHLHELALIHERSEAVGRRLDFLMQEFNRESNTIASKAADSETTAASIEMKVLIEQIREQVQNIE